MPNDASSTKTAAEIAFDECAYDRKYLLLSVPEFDVDPVEGDGKRRMTSYLRLGTVPDDWKSLPGAELELAVHADYGIGGGRDDLPIGGVVPDEVLPSDPIDDRYVRPTPTNLIAKLRRAVVTAVKGAHMLDEVGRWSEVEAAQVASAAAQRDANRAEADRDASRGFTVEVADEATDPARLPEGVSPRDFARFVVVDVESVRATLEERLRGCALGGPTAPLDEREAGAVIDSLRLSPVVELVLRKRPVNDAPWVARAPAELDAALAAVRVDAARRAAKAVLEALTDYPDMLLPDGTPKYPPFVDDLRYRGEEGDDSVYLTRAERLHHSRHLHTRGGWRDHSDGNRISTTHGDKVEVIRGNYKLMVLGRQDDQSSSNLVDYSGQITQSDDNMLLRVEYTRKDGVWNWETVNENVIQSEKISGKTYSWWWGVEQLDVVGSDDPVEPTDDNPMGNDADGNSRANPHITSRTWARSITEHTGSAKLPVPKVYSETWADDTEDRTTITRGTIETTTIGGGTIETTTIGGGTIATTTVGAGTVDTTTVGAAAVSITAVGGAQVDITGVGGAIVGLTASLANVDVSAHLIHVEASAIGVHAAFAVTGIDVDLNATGLKIEGTTSGKDIDLAKDKEESCVTKTETFTLFKHTAARSQLSYMTMAESGLTKTMTLDHLRVTASMIMLG
jgi:hypothetical protein